MYWGSIWFFGVGNVNIWWDVGGLSVGQLCICSLEWFWGVG